MQFPSPKSGVSFKLSTTHSFIERIIRFPSPKSGVSFKLIKQQEPKDDDNLNCFRPLKAGLVLNLLRDFKFKNIYLSEFPSPNSGVSFKRVDLK